MSKNKKVILTLGFFVFLITAFLFRKNLKIGLVKAFRLNYEVKAFDTEKRIHGRYLKIEKGKVVLEGNYLHGVAEGIFKSYYSNGKIKEKTFYKNNKMFGANLGYYEKGNPNYRIYYSNGLLYGDSFHYDEKGQMDIYGANDIEHSFFYCSTYKNLIPVNIIGTILAKISILMIKKQENK